MSYSLRYKKELAYIGWVTHDGDYPNQEEAERAAFLLAHERKLPIVQVIVRKPVVVSFVSKNSAEGFNLNRCKEVIE